MNDDDDHRRKRIHSWFSGIDFQEFNSPGIQFQFLKRTCILWFGATSFSFFVPPYNQMVFIHKIGAQAFNFFAPSAAAAAACSYNNEPLIMVISSSQLGGGGGGGFSSSASRFRCLMATANLNLILGSHKPYKRNRMQTTMLISRKIHVGSLQGQGQSPGEAPVISSKQDDGELAPHEGSDSVTGSVVALGKFDALHLGHRELAIQASKAGKPFLVSFVGMAEVLGWAPRAPIVAKCDRKRVLSSWAPYCNNVPPGEFSVEFSSVRQLSPRQFVEKLSKELGVRGVVAGENYRFGYKAAGDTKELVKLCEEYGMGAYIVSNVMDNSQLPGDTNSKISQEKGQVSSTRIRHALAEGNMEYVAELLGRKHRLILTTSEQEGLTTKGNRLSAPKSCLLNLSPKDGLYENCQLFTDNTIQVPCKAIIDSTHIHIESDEEGTWMQIPFQDSQPIGIEFGGSIVGL